MKVQDFTPSVPPKTFISKSLFSFSNFLQVVHRSAEEDIAPLSFSGVWRSVAVQLEVAGDGDAFSSVRVQLWNFWMTCNAFKAKNSGFYIGVSKNSGSPKWMVYNGKPYQNG